MGVKMIESEIKGTNNYPVLKTFNHKKSGNVVVILFDKPGSGICLYNKINLNKIGEYSENFAEYGFEDFDGELILKNKE